MIVSTSKGQKTIIDDCDADLAEYRWFCSHQGYTVRSYHVSKHNKPIIFLHSVIMERKLGHSVPDGYYVDHVNRNKLDNRRDNLRLASKGQNAINSKVPSNNTSGAKGVTWDKSKQRWQAQIVYQQKFVFIGRYKKVEDAIEARREKEVELFGEFATTVSSA